MKFYSPHIDFRNPPLPKRQKLWSVCKYLQNNRKIVNSRIPPSFLKKLAISITFTRNANFEAFANMFKREDTEKSHRQHWINITAPFRKKNETRQAGSSSKDHRPRGSRNFRSVRKYLHHWLCIHEKERQSVRNSHAHFYSSVLLNIGAGSRRDRFHKRFTAVPTGDPIPEVRR